MNAAVRRTCDEYKRMLASGEDQASIVGWLATEAGVQRPAIWKRLRAGGLIQPYARRSEGGQGRPRGGGCPGYTDNRRRKSEMRRSEIDAALEAAIRVDRDPCPRCGVRRDIGCGHSHARLGTVM